MKNLFTLGKNKLVILVAVYSLLLSLLFNYLFYNKEIGISWSIFVSTLIIGQLFLLIINKLLSTQLALLSVLSLYFSLMLGIRDGELISFVNFILPLLILLVGSRLLLRQRLSNLKINDYLISWFVAPWQIIITSFKSLNTHFKLFFKDDRASLWPIIKGVFATIPALLFFGALFAAADRSFNDSLVKIFSFNFPTEIFNQTIIVLVIFVISYGYFNFIQNKDEYFTSQEKLVDLSEGDRRGRALTLSFFIWPIVSLFFVFIIFQIKYLFAGGLVNDLTYAEYARHGFWELLVVTILSLVIILIADFYSSNIKQRLASFFAPVVLMISELFVIIASALKRMALYQAAYGWTLLRFFVISFIVFLTIVLLLFLLKLILKKNYNFFLLWLLTLAIVFVVIINFISPDKFVAKENIKRFYATQTIDVDYLLSLSTDAVPEILLATDNFSPEDKKKVIERMVNKRQWLTNSLNSWSSFNFSRYRGLNLINSYLAK